MKTQISKPARERTGYTKEYKQEALSLWRASGRSAAQVAAELGIRPPLLYRWARTERGATDDLGGGRKRRRSLEELEAENQTKCNTDDAWREGKKKGLEGEEDSAGRWG